MPEIYVSLPGARTNLETWRRTKQTINTMIDWGHFVAEWSRFVEHYVSTLDWQKFRCTFQPAQYVNVPGLCVAVCSLSAVACVRNKCENVARLVNLSPIGQ